MAISDDFIYFFTDVLLVNLLPDYSAKSIATFLLIILIILLIFYFLVVYFSGIFFSIGRFQHQNTLMAFQFLQS